MVSFQQSLTALLLLLVPIEISACKAKCEGEGDNEICTFKTKINIHAGELGYYSFEGCDGHNPTLEMQVGKTYIFDQSDKTNHMHPLGFAYYPGGAHNDMDELEPGIKPEGSASKCDENMSCPAPMYMVDDKYVGVYSNIQKFGSITADEEDFGLDKIEPMFFHPLTQWLEKKWSVALKFDIEDMDKDIFYFCHIHQYMSGRIKIIGEDGKKVSEEDLPELGFEYDEPSEYDVECGTHNTHHYQLPNDFCPEKFVCDIPEENESLKKFASCIEAMDCAMVHGMTNYVKSNSEIALFIHQMIPHHQNAVNMAKALLKSGAVKCEDILDDEDPNCVMEEISRSIINEQNYQIQQMRGILDALNYESEEDEACLMKYGEDKESAGVVSIASTMVKVISVIGLFVLMN